MVTDDTITAFLAGWTKAERDADTSTLDNLLTDDFVGIGPLGFVLTKQNWLQRFAGGLSYDEFSLDNPQPREYGDAAVVVGDQRQTGTMRGSPLPFEVVRQTAVLVRESGTWRLASVHFSFIAGTPGAPPLPKM